MRRNVLQSTKLQELQKRRRRVFLRRASVAAFAAILAVSLLSYLSRLRGLNIQTIEVEGESIVSEEEIRAIAEREMSGTYLWLIPKTNVLFFPKGRIGKVLANEQKRLDDIGLAVESSRTLRIEVTEREPAYLWCDGAETESCYFMDASGYVFDRAPYFSGSVYFRWLGPSGISPESPSGSRFAPEYFENLVSFTHLVRDLGTEPVACNIKDDGDAELLLRKAGTVQPKILFRPDDDLPHIAENLGAALETEPLKTRFEQEYAKLEYIDIRFDNKVYSKFLGAQ